MTLSKTDIPAGDRQSGDPSAAGLLAELFDWDDPSERFLDKLLATQCRLTNADAGAILRPGPSQELEILANYPQSESKAAFAWLATVQKPARKVVQKGKSVITRQEAPSTKEGASRSYQIIVPLHDRAAVRAVAAFRLQALSQQKILLNLVRLETTSLLLNQHEYRLTAERHHDSMKRLQQVIEVLNQINESKRFLSAAMGLCNEMATRLACNRVSIGFLEGRCIHLKAMSHADTFSRKMQAVGAIEEAMEECLDQDLEVIHPADATVMYTSRAAAKLHTHHGPSAILSIPLREGGDVRAVLTLERPPDQPFDNLLEVETIRLVGDLCAPRLMDLHRNDQWVGAKIAEGVRECVKKLMGPEHALIKLTAGLAFVLIVLLATLKGEYRITAPFTFKAREHQVVVAPFDSFAKRILVEPGDQVHGGQTLLGTLETSELRLKLAALKAERLGYQKQMNAAMRDRKTADAQIAQAHSDKISAQIRLIITQIEQADLVTPITGWVVSEDLKQRVGAPVETGDVLFEIASIDALRAEMYVPEAGIAGVMRSQTGQLASLGHPDQKIDFTIERINPMAEVIEHQNVFRVRARLDRHLDWMRPGMEGEAKISAGEKSYLWIASHRLVNWLRMKLWI